MALNKEQRFVRKEITVLSSDIITITEDKLENILNKNINKVKKSKDVLTSFGLCVSLYSIAFHTTFRNLDTISGETIKGICLCLFALSTIYFFKTLFHLVFYRVTSRDIIEEIKSYGEKKRIKSWREILNDVKAKLSHGKQKI